MNEKDRNVFVKEILEWDEVRGGKVDGLKAKLKW